MSTDNANRPRFRVYPRWFLLKRRYLVPVALKTRDVGVVAFDKMRSAGKLRVVPHWDEKVVLSIDNLIWMDNSHAITLVNFMWDICDPTQSEQNRNTVYEDCKNFWRRYSWAQDMTNWNLRMNPICTLQT
jgi:hypothetical protein